MLFVHAKTQSNLIRKSLYPTDEYLQGIWKYWTYTSTHINLVL